MEGSTQLFSPKSSGRRENRSRKVEWTLNRVIELFFNFPPLYNNRRKLSNSLFYFFLSLLLPFPVRCVLEQPPLPRLALLPPPLPSRFGVPFLAAIVFSLSHKLTTYYFIISSKDMLKGGSANQPQNKQRRCSPRILAERVDSNINHGWGCDNGTKRCHIRF